MLGHAASLLRSFEACLRPTAAVCVVAFVVATPSRASAQTAAPADPPQPPTTQGPSSGSSAPSGAPTAGPSLPSRTGVNGAGTGRLTMTPSAPSGAGTSAGAGTGATALPPVDPSADSKDLARQGAERPEGDRATDVFSEDWWGRTRPVIELHGYFRTRGELFHNFALGRHDTAKDALWPQPLDNTYTDRSGVQHAVKLCGSDPAALTDCNDKSQATANLRLRLNPEIHISDNLRILTQIDALDNLVLGSKVNATGNPVDVKRAWGEYLSPVGQIRFGRMPDHWGLGMLYNSGDYLDADYQSTIDRMQFVTGLRSLDLYFGASWDFVGSGPTAMQPSSGAEGGQPYNTANLANVDQWSAFIARRSNPELQRLALARGEVVLNGGVYARYQKQHLDVASGRQFDPNTADNGLERRGTHVFVPDLWLQLLWTKLRVEAEAAMFYGSIERLQATQDAKIRQYGLTTQTEFKAVEDKLRLQFNFGWASGDPWVEGLGAGQGQQQRWGAGPISTFRMNPAYQVDLIFFRKILTQVEGAYYYRPGVEYDFLRSPNGQKFGGAAGAVYTRASQALQTPGNNANLGFELNLSLYYQAKDGALNDNPSKTGGLFTMIQYGVLFPLAGLDYLRGQQTPLVQGWDTASAQTVRLFLGVSF